MGTDRLKVVEIEINSHCNMSCEYCPNSIEERKEVGEMTHDLFEKIISNLIELKFKGVISFHFYNEPMLAKNLDSFVKILKEKLPLVTLQLYTNGTLLTATRFRELIKLGVDAFKVTKHLSQTENYIFDSTYLELTDLEKKKVIYLSYRDLDLTNRAGVLEHISNKIPVNTPCFLPSVMTVITVNGSMLPCYEDFRQELEMGSLKSSSIKDIWYGDKFQAFRENLRQKGGRLLNETCKKCNNFNLPSIHK